MTDPNVHAPDPHAEASGLLQGRRVLVTGGTSGIGAEIVARAAAAGAQGGAVLDLPAAIAAATLPAGWHGLPVDVRDDASVAAAVATAAERLGGIDVVVAAAGVVPSWAPIADVDLDDFDRVLAINARGVLSTLKHAAPHLGADGAVVVIGSLNSWRGDANIASYVASKHAVLGIVRSAALSLGPAGVRVNAVAPGPIATEALLGRMAARSVDGLPVEDALASAAAGTALGRIATTADVAGAVLFLASDLAAGITGHLLPVDGGII